MYLPHAHDLALPRIGGYQHTRPPRRSSVPRCAARRCLSWCAESYLHGGQLCRRGSKSPNLLRNCKVGRKIYKKGPEQPRDALTGDIVGRRVANSFVYFGDSDMILITRWRKNSSKAHGVYLVRMYGWLASVSLSGCKLVHYFRYIFLSSLKWMNWDSVRVESHSNLNLIQNLVTTTLYSRFTRELFRFKSKFHYYALVHFNVKSNNCIDSWHIPAMVSYNDHMRKPIMIFLLVLIYRTIFEFFTNRYSLCIITGSTKFCTTRTIACV